MWLGACVLCYVSAGVCWIAVMTAAENTGMMTLLESVPTEPGTRACVGPAMQALFSNLSPQTYSGLMVEVACATSLCIHSRLVACAQRTHTRQPHRSTRLSLISHTSHLGSTQSPCTPQVLATRILAPLVMAVGLLFFVKKNGKHLVNAPQLCPQLANTVAAAAAPQAKKQT